MMSWKIIIDRLERLGHWFFYVTLRLFGYTGALILLRCVVFCYVLCSYKIHKNTFAYLSRRFPKKGRIAYWLHTFRNVLSFGEVLVERGWLGVKPGATLQGNVVDFDTLIDLAEKGNGVILLTGHVGNWQSALAHLGNLPVKVNALMQYDQGAAAKHYFDLRKEQRSFSIIDADGNFGGMVDAVAALQRGEIVTIMGDRYVKGSSSSVEFLGNRLEVPDGAYLLAAAAGAPVAVVFAAKTGNGECELKLWDHFYPNYDSREERSVMLQQCSARYFRALEDYLSVYPYQWYNFYDLWKK